MISAFDQAAKFLKSIDVPTPLDQAKLMNQLSAVFSNAVQFYANRIYEQAVAQSASPMKEKKNLLSFLKPKSSSVQPFEFTSQVGLFPFFWCEMTLSLINPAFFV